MNEQWRSVVGFEGIYEVSSEGKVYSHITNKILKGYHDSDGYVRLTLINKNGKKEKRGLHRVVAEAFLENEDNKPTVDHINQNKDDNRVENLRWATKEEQIKNRPKSRASGQHPTIQKIDENGDVVGEFETYSAAVRSVIDENDTRSAHSLAYKIKKVCNSEGRKTALGYSWRYKK